VVATESVLALLLKPCNYFDIIIEVTFISLNEIIRNIYKEEF